MPKDIISPAAGVYSGMVNVRNDGYYSVINVGKRPTYGDIEEELIEAHILGFDQDIYHEEIEVSFLKKLRDEKKFNSEAELKAQIELDCKSVVLTI